MKMSNWARIGRKSAWCEGN